MLDNAEHLLPEIATDVAELLSKATGPTLLMTSRERLQIAAEREFAVAAMDADDATELFVARAAASGVSIQRSPDVQAVCDRLDRLPLALQARRPTIEALLIEQSSSACPPASILLRGG